MAAAEQRHEFQTETKQLLDLMIHSLYSHKEIFLRELISNASDALDKLRFEGLTHPELLPEDELHVFLEADPKARTLTIRDNGIGMTEEVRQNCLRTHFTTKRDNALYEGYSAGMGLGLSFVAVVLEHHGSELEVESEPLKGATFRMSFLLADRPEEPATEAEQVAG